MFVSPSLSTLVSPSLLRAALFAVVLTVAGGHLIPAVDASPEATVSLLWRNGDELNGQILPEGADETIRFEARPFGAPLNVRPGQLSAIRFPDLADAGKPATKEDISFEVSLHNGDRLRGKLLKLDRDGIILDCSPLFGIVEIKRESIARLGLSTGGRMSFSGLGELSEWSSTGRDRKPTDWFTNLRGELTTHHWGGNLYRPIALPEKVEVHFRAAFPSGNPGFQIGLLRDPAKGPMLETWDKILVLTYRSRFVPVMALSEATKELDLRLFWDQSSGEVRLCSPSGEPLATLTEATPGLPETEKRRTSEPLDRGFYVLNRNAEMKLLSLHVREWDGRPVPVIDLAQPRLHLRDQPVRFQIDDVTYSGKGSNLKVGANSLPLSDLLEMTFPIAASAEPTAAPESVTRIAWHSGMTLSGRFLRIDPEGLSLSTSWSATPVKASLDGAREVRLPENAEPLDVAGDTLTAAGISLRGTMRLAEAASTDPSLISWLPPGALASVPVKPEEKITILRSPLADEALGPQVSLSQARAYLNTDEILTGRLLALSPGKVSFESRLTGILEIPAAHLRALDTGTAGRILEGFKDSEWEEIEDGEDEVVLTGDKAILKGGSFGNPSIVLGDRIRFNAEWVESFGAMTLRLFTSGPENSSPSTDIIIAAQGNRLFIGKLNESGAFSFSGDQIPIIANRASIEISATPEKIEVRIDGKPGLSIDVEHGKVSGNGLYFKMGGGWQGWNQEHSVIEITQFRIESTPGSVPRRIIDPRAKEHLLAIPRQLREDVPTHLLIAPNGDLLRGKLESGDESIINFAAKEASLTIPGNRVSTVIWLPPPITAPAAIVDGKSEEKRSTEDADEEEVDDPKIAKTTSEPPATVLAPEIGNFKITQQLVLRDGSRLQIVGERVDGNRLIGRSAILGECSIPLENIREIRSGPPVPLSEADRMELVVFNDWQPLFTPDPVIPDAEGQATSPLIGKEAPPFELGGLEENTFKLADHRGKVVVLDFWATWCGPCIKAMPDVMAAVSAFPEGSVAFCAINQAESAPIVSGFLEARKWASNPVALDFNMKVSRAYEVESIPHTVVIDQAGKVAWVHSGYSPELKRELFEAIAKLLSR